MVSFSLCILIMFNAELSHVYLACIGREELFGWVKLVTFCTSVFTNTYYQHFQSNPSFVFLSYNPIDFYAKIGPSGVEFKGPLWHPIRYLSGTILTGPLWHPIRNPIQSNPLKHPSDLTLHQGSCEWDHLQHVHTRANLLLEHLQVQEGSGLDYR